MSYFCDMTENIKSAGPVFAAYLTNIDCRARGLNML